MSIIRSTSELMLSYTRRCLQINVLVDLCHITFVNRISMRVKLCLTLALVLLLKFSYSLLAIIKHTFFPWVASFLILSIVNAISMASVSITSQINIITFFLIHLEAGIVFIASIEIALRWLGMILNIECNREIRVLVWWDSNWLWNVHLFFFLKGLTLFFPIIKHFGWNNISLFFSQAKQIVR